MDVSDDKKYVNIIESSSKTMSRHHANNSIGETIKIAEASSKATQLCSTNIPQSRKEMLLNQVSSHLN